MANSNLNGFARVSRRAPSAFAICDTCGYQFNRTALVEQMEYFGNEIRKTGFLVCQRTCNDIPQPQISTPILPNDPYPVRNPRPELYQSLPFGLASDGGSGEDASGGTPAGGLP
jgi:hypothetical protein